MVVLLEKSAEDVNKCNADGEGNIEGMRRERQGGKRKRESKIM